MEEYLNDTTIVITSCNRHDLLERTLRSLTIYNSDKHSRHTIVVEDGAGDPSSICVKYGAELIRSGARIGQAAAIDLAYQRVSTKYIFHCEDDWEFYRSGFIERSRAVLEADLSTGVVWLRSWGDTNGYPLSFRSACRTFGVLSNGYHGVWHGFSWNPGLRRLSDYIDMGDFSSMIGTDEHPEISANKRFLEKNLRAVILDETGYVRHIGDGRHVGDGRQTQSIVE